MALDFPSSPADGQIYNNYQWSASSGVWKAIPTVPQVATQSAVPPASPNKGDIWFNTTDGVFFTYYDDGTSKQWIEMMSSGIPSSPSYNYVLNSGFDIWQRGTSGTPTSAATRYVADRWETYRAGFAAGLTVSRQTATDATLLPNVQYCMRVQRTAANTGTATIVAAQALETVNSIPLAGKTVTLSFYARAGANYSSASNALSWYAMTGTGTDQSMNTGFTSQSNVISQTATLTTSWQRFSATALFASNITQAGVYFSYTPIGTAGTSDYFEITGVQLEEGSIATPFRRQTSSIEAELAACQRYYWRTADSTNYPYIGFGLAESVSRVSIPVKHPVVMRVPPTGLETSNLSVWDGNTIISTPSSVTILATNTSVDATWIYFDKTSAFTNKIPYMLIGTINLDSYIGLSAEL